MTKFQLNRPTLILLYGFPGSGKTHFARQLTDEINAAHVHGDRIRNELFEQPRFDKQENEIVQHLMEYMTEEFLHAGISVIFDMNAMRLSQRRMLRDMARKVKAQPLLVWVQIDIESAFSRVVKRDRRKSDDKYAIPIDRTTFEDLVGIMQNPSVSEDYMVISGKHTFNAQWHTMVKKLHSMSLLTVDTNDSRVVKPELVNLIPNPSAGRVDPTRRNIIIR